MQSLSPRDRDAVSRRRARVECTLCGRYIELVQLRMHLRDMHRLESARLDQILADARRTALRGRSRPGGFTTG